MAQNATGNGVDELVEAVGRWARTRGVHIAVAESLTGGQLAAALAAGADSKDWFRGGIVAYQSAVKHEVLGTPVGPVVNAQTAAAMATSALSMFDADLAVAVTGVGGPGPEEDRPAGTVFIAVARSAHECQVSHHRFAGDPVGVMNQTILAAISRLLDVTVPAERRSG